MMRGILFAVEKVEPSTRYFCAVGPEDSGQQLRRAE